MTRTQCRKCPWRLDVNSGDIPVGFNYEVHRRLGETVRHTATPLGNDVPLHMMACHETAEGTCDEKPCVGWLVHQLGPGNNIRLRLQAMRDDSFADVKCVGRQRSSFEEIRPTTHGDPNCDHHRTKPGAPMPAASGSCRTEICCDCGAWRTLSLLGDMKSFWLPWEEYVERLAKNDACLAT